MSKEMNRREVELNEQALEGVSGGTSNSRDKARELCMLCCSSTNPTGTCNKKHQTDLDKYLAAHGLDSVHIPEQCPYHNH